MLLQWSEIKHSTYTSIRFKRIVLKINNASFAQV